MRPLIREFLKFILSREGQAIVVRDGYYPLPAEVAGRYLEAIERQADPQRNLLRNN
jgi:phosphate transport system substrate-binding protein